MPERGAYLLGAVMVMALLMAIPQFGTAENGGYPVIMEDSKALINTTVNHTEVLTIKEKAEDGIFSLFGVDIHLPSPLDNVWGVFLANILFWVFIGFVIYLILDPFVKHFTKKTKTELDDILLAIVKKPIFLLIAIYGIVRSLEVLPMSNDATIIILKIYYFFLIIIVGYLVYKVYKDIVMYVAHKIAKKTDTEIDDVLLPLLDKIGTTVIFAFVILSLLSYMGIDVTVLVAGMGIAGLVIAFAAQDTLSNFFAGIFLLVDRPFDIGDVIRLEDGTYCQVKKVGMRSTTIYDTFNHQTISIPNSSIAGQSIVNVSRPDPRIKVGFTFGVAYGSDIDRVKAIVKEILSNTEHVVIDKDRKPIVNFNDFGDSAIEIFVKFWVDHFDNQWSVAEKVKSTIYKRLGEEGIEIPFPQHVVWFGDKGEVVVHKKGQ